MWARVPALPVWKYISDQNKKGRTSKSVPLDLKPKRPGELLAAHQQFRLAGHGSHAGGFVIRSVFSLLRGIGFDCVKLGGVQDIVLTLDLRRGRSFCLDHLAASFKD